MLGLKLPKNKFSEIEGDVWKDLKKEIIQSVFRTAGIYPFNTDVISQDIFHADTWMQWQNSNQPNDL